MNFGLSFDFIYNKNSRVTKINWKITYDTYISTFDFSRNTSGQITGYVYREAPEVCHSVTYSLDKDGNYVSAKVNDVESGRSYTGSETYTYPDNLITKVVRESSKNNFTVQITTSKWILPFTEFTHAHFPMFASGLPIKTR